MSPKTDRVSVVKYAFCAPKPAHIRRQKSFGTSALAFCEHFSERFALAFRYLEHG
ncbi:hypothetical protein BOTBODRAFT_38279 [Botryobasidium botryosum FD-172 SS1]|uniref:Uncharacterized protein n=1 Tax=Botryobasidium botryosum (strain FD-172 SS1) TaxID=930990 RepID=A0A067LXV6_BOTB1|nr:hypothetical protein BOTBODRAFT_38279 [Botryobasidium botryosum FD-172 SS1]